MYPLCFCRRTGLRLSLTIVDLKARKKEDYASLKRISLTDIQELINLGRNIKFFKKSKLLCCESQYQALIPIFCRLTD